MPLLEHFLIARLAVRALQVEVVALHVIHGLAALVGDAVFELQGNDVGLARLTPEEYTREGKLEEESRA